MLRRSRLAVSSVRNVVAKSYAVLTGASNSASMRARVARDLALVGGKLQLAEAVAHRVERRREALDAFVLGRHPLQVADQHQVAQRARLLERDELHLDGQLLLGAGGRQRRGEAVAVELVQDDRAHRGTRQQEHHRAEANREARTDLELAQDHSSPSSPRASAPAAATRGA
jgi:hypothetical protein